jgi:hypothetical protein
MAITMDDILASLEEASLRYELHQITQEPVILFPTNNFLNESGSHLLAVVIQLTENGEYIKFFVPSAYHIPEDESAYALLKSFTIIAWQVKLLDFEVDPGDGEVRPTIDFPIEDGSITTGQIRRCCKTLARLVDIFHPYLKYALLHNQVHDDLLQNDIRPIFEAYHEQEGDIKGLRERLSSLRAHLEDHNQDSEANSESDEDSPEYTPNKDETPQSTESSVDSGKPAPEKKTLDTSGTGDDEDSSDEDWI